MRLVALTGLSLALAACASEQPEETTDPVEDGTLSEPENIIAPTDFASLTLGGTIRGPVGRDIEASLISGDVAVGDISSRVQCPDGVDRCVPDQLEDGTIYTYVYEIRPGFDDPNDEPFAMPDEVVAVQRARSFGLTFPAYGFTGVAGYSVFDSEDVLADGLNASISCEQGRIIWTFPEESGWGSGETITFFWQTTQPPTGPTGVYRFTADEHEASGIGPMPAVGGEMAAVCE
jgi:hypothetical protein